MRRRSAHLSRPNPKAIARKNCRHEMQASMRASASIGAPRAGSSFLSWCTRIRVSGERIPLGRYAEVILFFEQSHSTNEPEWLVVGHQLELLLPRALHGAPVVSVGWIPRRAGPQGKAPNGRPGKKACWLPARKYEALADESRKIGAFGHGFTYSGHSGPRPSHSRPSRATASWIK